MLMTQHFVCTSYAAATRMDCALSHDLCRCTSAESSANCDCQPGDIPELLLQNPHLLPTNEGEIWLRQHQTTVAADIPLSTMELTISVKNLRAQSRVEASHCHINMTTLDGCYSCSRSAITNVTCTTDFGSAVANVQCGELIFAVRCKTTAITEAITLSLNHPQVDEMCQVHCPAATTLTRLHGTLRAGSLDEPTTHSASTTEIGQNTYTNFKNIFSIQFFVNSIKHIKNVLFTLFNHIPFMIIFIVIFLLAIFINCLHPLSIIKFLFVLISSRRSVANSEAME